MTYQVIEYCYDADNAHDPCASCAFAPRVVISGLDEYDAELAHSALQMRPQRDVNRLRSYVIRRID